MHSNRGAAHRLPATLLPNQPAAAVGKQKALTEQHLMPAFEPLTCWRCAPRLTHCLASKSRSSWASATPWASAWKFAKPCRHSGAAEPPSR